jgi:hypothetical protein
VYKKKMKKENALKGKTERREKREKIILDMK